MNIDPCTGVPTTRHVSDMERIEASTADDPCRAAQLARWDRQVWAEIHRAETTSQPYPRTDRSSSTGRLFYGFPAYLAAERAVIEAAHAEALTINR